MDKAACSASYPPAPRCRALVCAETKREAIPNRRRITLDDNAVLIASPAPQPRDRRESRQTGRSGGVARGGIGNRDASPGVLYPLLQTPAAARQHPFPARRSVRTPPPPKAAKKAPALRGRKSPPLGKGSISPPASAPQERRKNFTLCFREIKKDIPFGMSLWWKLTGSNR